MNERGLEIKVGVLLLAGVAGLVLLLWLMGELQLSRPPAIYADMAHTGNIAEGAPVKLGGVRAGRVEIIELLPDRRDQNGDPLPVRMELSIEERVFRSLHQDAEVQIATRGPLGEAYLELRPGSASAPPLKPGASLRAVESARIEELVARMGRALDAAGKMLEDHPQALAELIEGVTKLSGGLGDAISDNREQLRILIGELASTSRELRQLAKAAREQLEPGGKAAALIDDASASAKVLRRDLPQLSGDAKAAMAGLSALTSGLTAEDGQRLKLAIQRYTEAGDRLDQLAGRAERILARIEAGQGTLGGLAKDDQIYKDIKALVADLKQHPWKVLWKQ